MRRDEPVLLVLPPGVGPTAVAAYETAADLLAAHRAALRLLDRPAHVNVERTRQIVHSLLGSTIAPGAVRTRRGQGASSPARLPELKLQVPEGMGLRPRGLHRRGRRGGTRMPRLAAAARVPDHDGLLETDFLEY